ncbi:hypothetical protein COMNV_00513 [Commensalibacter sp. Nvir]|uniref:double-strand break repair protein AddB n=1 Tax=Commensalibacter sp. Nvir TaxID=3069817 RepID=UPI002D44D251|nr:hypothetical protein COMNV_00513 [Commensalibacter sp. Nvir]
MKLITIPFNNPFLELVAQHWIQEIGLQNIASQKGLILVPNRRTAKTLVETFLKVMQGKSILLPKIVPVGDLDEAAMVLSGQHQFALPPAIHPIRRTALLSVLIKQMNKATQVEQYAGEVWQLAASLGELMDEAEWSGCALKDALPNAVEADYAEHWQEVLKFLTIVTHYWPQWLKDNTLMNPVARKLVLLTMQAEFWNKNITAEPIWAIGFATANSEIVGLLNSVLQLPNGKLIISNLQKDLPEDIWNSLPLTHPYAEMAKMLRSLGISRKDFQCWEDSNLALVSQERIYAFHQSLLPAELLEQWFDNSIPVHLKGCYLSEPFDQQHEAVSIALAIRDALETPYKKIALVTPDRGLATRVVAELGRWGIFADDGAGESLYKTPAAILLGLILRASLEQFTPISLLALLKHPFVCCGYARHLCRNYTRLLEINVLRQFCASGLDEIRSLANQKISQLNQAKSEPLSEGARQYLSNALEVKNMLNQLDDFMSPLLNEPEKRSMDQWITVLVTVAEALTTNHNTDGEEILWSGAEGNALAEHLRNLMVEANNLVDLTLQEFESILNASYHNIFVHSQRVLRGRTLNFLHPRVNIWGLIEARLQTVDLVILGGLSEGIWPETMVSGPWICRPMREKMNIVLPECQVGYSAYDFLALCCSIPKVILSVPQKRENAPAVPSRWVTRLKAWLYRRSSHIDPHPSIQWSTILDTHEEIKPIDPPCPKPPLKWRPKTMSIAEVEKWIKDPYELYAQKILKLKKIPDLQADLSASLFGKIVHEGLKNVYENKFMDPQSVKQSLLNVLNVRKDISLITKQWWRPRLIRLAEWIYETECKRRSAGESGHIYVKKEGIYDFYQDTELSFTLQDVADRIEVKSTGAVEIIDYKTGKIPSQNNIKCGDFPKLPLEAAMLQRGAFGEELVCQYDICLSYWKLQGKRDDSNENLKPNEAKEKKNSKEEIQQLIDYYWDCLLELIKSYHDPGQPYLFRPHSHKFLNFNTNIIYYGDFAHLARVSEWENSRKRRG